MIFAGLTVDLTSIIPVPEEVFLKGECVNGVVCLVERGSGEAPRLHKFSSFGQS